MIIEIMLLRSPRGDARANGRDRSALSSIWLTAGAALLMLDGCAPTSSSVATGSAAAPTETIAISVGPCFGFCPVYVAKVASDGTVIFSGEKHTAVLGERRRAAGRDVYRAIALELAPFRPADGTIARVECDAAISDTSSYTITWTGQNGRQTVATHQRGCSSGPGKALDQLLGSLPKQLGIDAWAEQTTRPGTPRG